MRPHAALIALVALSMPLVACGDDEEQPTGTSAQRGAATQEATGTPGGDPHGCRQVEQPKPKPDGRQAKPTDRLDPARSYDVVLETSCGSFAIRLDVKSSPATTASFASLARNGFFDGTVFHRIVPGFVIQGGDPTGRGTGGPGYSTVDRPPRDATYTTGVVAMAKAEAEPPGTAGSQFFVVTGEDAGLPPDYAILGRVAKGIEVTQRIGELGDPASGGTGTPTQPVVIEQATVRES